MDGDQKVMVVFAICATVLCVTIVICAAIESAHRQAKPVEMEATE